MRGGAFADRALERLAVSLDPADRRLAQELTYGVLRQRGRLDYLIGCLVRDGLEGLEPDVLDVLRLGAYQLLELDRVPDYAVISQAVEAAKGVGGRGVAALTNAVLRRLHREGRTSCMFPDRDTDALAFLAAWGSHPTWLLERWLGRWTLAEVERLVSYNNNRPSVYLTVLGPRNEALGRLQRSGIEAEAVDICGAAVRIDSAQVARALAIVDAVVQDPAAATVLDYADLSPELGVLDLCAAPGGKSAILAGRGHRVWAFDISAARLRRLTENRARLELERLYVGVGDGTQPPVSRAPAVLLDVPCTGTGTLARHPDARWRLQPPNLEAAALQQRRLLDAAADIVAPGGWLIYATCSLEPEENEDQVDAFLSRHQEFELEPPRASAVRADLVGPDGELRILPQRHELDGVYAARLQRRRS